MKKLLLLLSAFTLLFISCEEEDESHEIEGTWQLTSGSSIDGDETYTYDIEGCEANTTFTFDGSTLTTNDFYSEEVYNEETQEYEDGECLSESFTESYSISGNTITVDGDSLTYTISGDTLTITYTEEYEGETYTSTTILTRV